jgi:hypothetical protein
MRGGSFATIYGYSLRETQSYQTSWVGPHELLDLRFTQSFAILSETK